ncbi:magnesium transporter [Mycoplasma ovis str. Michigan]|uniref:Magnesium transporter n=1 Tax=Mycoplasma ovis str. Michigan TaxID=1415773 RepID=A0ABM5P0H9_9MOLU|nr:magnesium transporter [Mycoplasma ovis]AHC39921.1 magnesium transporter [Mycoplasma ovis str. Michigan]
MLFRKNKSLERDKYSSRLSTKLIRAFELKNYASIKELSRAYSVPTLVKALEKLSNFELINIIFITLSEERLEDFFFSFSEYNRLTILKTIRPALLSKLLTQLQPDKIAEILSIVDSDLSKKIIYLSSPQQRKELNIISSFSHSQVGSIMNTSILTIPENFKIPQALNYIKKKRNKIEIGDELFVVNLNQEVVGSVNIQNLFFSTKNSLSVGEIVDKDYISISASGQIGEAVDLFQKYPFTSAAVLNEKDQILGVITSKDILPEIVDESMEDVHRFYGIVSLQHSYIKSTAWEVVKSRLFWLIVLLFSTTLTTLIIDKFEHLGVQWTTGLSSAILVPLIPLITDMCGNSGSQTATSIIQSFASNELSSKDLWFVTKKELKVSVIVGGIVSIVNFLRLLAYFAVFPISTDKVVKLQANSSSLLPIHSEQWKHFPIFLQAQQKTYNPKSMGYIGSAISSLSLFVVIILSKLTGVFIPFFAYKFFKDPASMTTPALTTILDAIGTLIFFSIGVGIIAGSTSLLVCSKN